MKIQAALKFAAANLQQSSTPILDARLLLGKVTGMEVEELLLKYDKNLSAGERQEFLRLVSRRKKKEPIAYILGKQEFYGLDFIVNKHVLIPRPETELLIDLVMGDYNSSSKENISILDLGTGSGAIAVAFAKFIANAKITAIDISDDALTVAKDNATKHNVAKQIEFIKSNWYENLGSKKYDYIVSNPPYVARAERPEIADETYLFEPEIALYAADNGLANYKTIISTARQYLADGGKLLLEIGYLQKNALAEILKEYGFGFEIKTDLAGHDRVIVSYP